MTDVTVADAKAHLSALVSRAELGDHVRITRRGKPVAQITAVERTRAVIDVTALRALTKTMQPQADAGVTTVSQMREAARY